MSKNEKDSLATFIRSLTVFFIIFSIFVTYYVMIVEKDYTIFTNPDGPETEDYFEELFAE
jgi:hypothetical protein